MADDGSEQSQSVWPMPTFYFRVTMDGEEMTFQEVSGLDADRQPIVNRAGNDKVFSTIKMPGLRQAGNLTLKKGVFTRDNTFWDWFSGIKMNTIKRQNLTISLLDGSGAPTMVWNVANAFPTKITSSDLKADGNEVAIESIEIAYEQITVENA
ncbi:phage tail protein [Tateyamaria omphalii]|uniref:phage tail protein n=1 Tax=Tateyamaria omphalii TaxID=299262 RepID=UPI00167BACD8|nr:phage tail protein [Tateyamaria omphalii]GGX53667.1 phage tail protein [Tateyamaria omphalii]